MFQSLMVSMLSIVFFILVFRLYQEKRVGKIKITLLNWFDDYVDDGITRTAHVYLVLNISYRLNRSTHTKEQCAILINNIVQSACENRGFVIGKKDEETLKKIKDIMGKITPVIQERTDSAIKSINYGISWTIFTNWPKEIFAQT